MHSTQPHLLQRLLVVFLLTASAFAIAQPTATRVSREVVFEVDLSDEIAAGRFDVARDRVGLRGAGKPLAWDRSVEASRVGASAAASDTNAANTIGKSSVSSSASALYRVVVRFERPAEGGQLLQYKWKIERAGGAAMMVGKMGAIARWRSTLRNKLFPENSMHHRDLFRCNERDELIGSQ